VRGVAGCLVPALKKQEKGRGGRLGQFQNHFPERKKYQSWVWEKKSGKKAKRRSKKKGIPTMDLVLPQREIKVGFWIHSSNEG